MSQIASGQIKICFTFDYQEKDNMYFDINEKLINVFQKYSEKKGIELDSLYFLCNGEKIEDFQKTLEQLASSDDKRNMEIIILVFKVNLPDDESTINAYFVTKYEAKMIPCNKKDKIKDICNKYEKLTNIKPKSRIYKYKGVELDSEKTFDDYDNINGVIFINVIPKTLILIIFAYLNVLYNVECYKEDKIEDICNDFASKNNIDKKKVMFKHYDNLIDQNKTLNQFLNENNINIGEIKIDVIETNLAPLSPPIHTSPATPFIGPTGAKVIIILTISSIIITSIVLIKAIPDKCNLGYKLIDDKCIVDYFIKAVYVSKGNEKVKLISDSFQMNKISKMIIDGKSREPTQFYTFDSRGDHSVYYSFTPYQTNSYDSKENGGSSLFSGIEKLTYAEFSDFNENYPDVRFDSMFKNCTNLKYVDLSKISIDYTTYDSYVDGEGNSSEYFDSISHMFYGCTSLTSLNFPILKFNIKDMSYSFAYCSSLKSLNLIFGSCYGISEGKSMSNAFRNCSSLETIGLVSFNAFEDYSSIFMGCVSLKEITFYSIISEITKYMNNIFTDCHSLIKMNYEFFSSKMTNPLFSQNDYDYNNEYDDDDDDDDDDYDDTRYCLQSSNLIDISEMFSGCSSLTSIDLSGLVTNNISNYESLFYDCNSLSYIDISSFTHNDLNDSNLSIFNKNIPLKPTIIINEDFYERIQSQIPPDSKIEEEENCFIDDIEDMDMDEEVYLEQIELMCDSLKSSLYNKNNDYNIYKLILNYSS